MGRVFFVVGKEQIYIHISNITFYYNRFSTSNESLRNMGRFRIQILKNNNWETILYNCTKRRIYRIATEWEFIKFGYYRKKIMV